MVFHATSTKCKYVYAIRIWGNIRDSNNINESTDGDNNNDNTAQHRITHEIELLDLKYYVGLSLYLSLLHSLVKKIIDVDINRVFVRGYIDTCTLCLAPATDI